MTCSFVIRISFALDDLDRTARALAKTGPEAVTIRVGHQPGFAVNDAKRPFGARGHTQAAAVTAIQQGIAVCIPALPGTNVAAQTAVGFFVIIIQATVFSDCKISHKESFAVCLAMSCQKNTVSLVCSQGFFKNPANNMVE